MKNALLATLLFLTNNTFAQFCDTNALIIDQVRAIDTDPNISWEAARHYTFYNPSCTPKNKLLVHMVGTYAAPYQSVLFPKMAANLGYHVLSLKYENGLAAQSACDTSSNIDCHYNFRKEIIDGTDVSSEIQVDTAHSIQNRLIKLLQYMDVNNSNQNWGQYFTGDSIHWQSVLLSGHSQGGGHAAMMAIDRPVDRVIMFASPNDYSIAFNQVANWTNLPHITPDEAYYSFNNRNDLVAEFAWQYGAAQNLDVMGDSTFVDGNECPYVWSHNLYTTIDLPVFGSDHGSVVHDSNVPLDGNGVPVFQEVWLYLLGDSCLPLGVEEEELKVEIYPNPVGAMLNVSLSSNAITYTLKDISGRSIKMQEVNSNEFQMDCSDLSEGLYQLVITTQEAVISKSFLKN